jgi:hypothetical protein
MHRKSGKKWSGASTGRRYEEARGINGMKRSGASTGRRYEEAQGINGMKT